MFPETDWLGQIILYQKSRSKCYDFCQLILAQPLRPGQSYVSLFVFLPFRGYGQSHIGGRSFETYRLSKSPFKYQLGRRAGPVNHL
jgi:hypothetical protein